MNNIIESVPLCRICTHCIICKQYRLYLSDCIVLVERQYDEFC